jgi:hypothetical protein
MQTTIALCLLLVSSLAFAHEGHHASSAKAVRLTGEVVDITCFVDHGGAGEKHAACAQKCLAAGNPVGLLVGDTLYLVVMSSHEPPSARLAAHAGKRVQVTGRATTKNGLHVLDLETVEDRP